MVKAVVETENCNFGEGVNIDLILKEDNQINTNRLHIYLIVGNDGKAIMLWNTQLYITQDAQQNPIHINHFTVKAYLASMPGRIKTSNELKVADSQCFLADAQYDCKRCVNICHMTILGPICRYELEPDLTDHRQCHECKFCVFRRPGLLGITLTSPRLMEVVKNNIACSLSNTLGTEPSGRCRNGRCEDNVCRAIADCPAVCINSNTLRFYRCTAGRCAFDRDEARSSSSSICANGRWNNRIIVQSPAVLIRLDNILEGIIGIRDIGPETIVEHIRVPTQIIRRTSGQYIPIDIRVFETGGSTFSFRFAPRIETPIGSIGLPSCAEQISSTLPGSNV
jgi:NAD-dependent dihydropyrimidine dehydrogenase PreA subunit